MKLFDKFLSTIATRTLAQLDPGNPALFQGSGGYTQLTASGQLVNADLAYKESTVFSCIRLLSDTLAMMPLILFKLQADGDRNPDIRDGLFGVLRYSPNSRQTAFEFIKFLIVVMLLRGYFLGRIIRQSGSGQVLEIEPCHPDFTQFGIDSSGKFYWRTVLCRDVATGNSSKIFTLYWKNALYVPYGQVDGVYPISPISQMAETIGFAREMREHGATLFKNNQLPTGILTTDKVLRKDGRNRMKKSWRENMGGGNKGGVALLEQGTSFKAISISNQDSQYLESRQFTKESICGFLGVPTHLISDTKRAKGWSTTEQQMMEYLVFTNSALVRRVEDSIRLCLIPTVRWGKQEVKFDYSELLRGDISARTKQQEIHLKYGVKNPNEVRHEEGRNNRDGGDEYASLPTAQPNTETTNDEESDDANNENNEEDDDDEND